MRSNIGTLMLNDLQAEFGTAPAAEGSEVQNAAQLLFLSCLLQRSRKAGLSCYNVTPFPENGCSTSLFTIGYKRLTEGGLGVFLMEGFDGGFCLAATEAEFCLSSSEQLSAQRTLYIGFRKAMLRRTWDSASLRTTTLRVTLMQFSDVLLLFVCKSEHQDFKRNMGQCKSEGKDFKRDYAKEKLRKTWDRVSLRKETLKNRKEARF
jgi:hypothetical protein